MEYLRTLLSSNKQFYFQPLFVDLMLFFFTYCHTHRESNKPLCSQAICQTREQWLLNLHRSSNYIFHTGTFPNVFSYFHRTLILAEWVNSTDGNLFPLCRSTAFKLTFEESINRRHSGGSRWCPIGL